MPSGYNKLRMRKRIVNAARMWNRGRDKCNFTSRPVPKLVFNSDSGPPATNFGDDVSTVEFVVPGSNDSLLGNYCPDPGPDSIVLGCEHTHSVAGVAKATDIGINKTVALWLKLNGITDNSIDLWSLAGHEFGHSLDVAHTTQQDHDVRDAQVMYATIKNGDRKRRLGRYDLFSACEAQDCE